MNKTRNGFLAAAIVLILLGVFGCANDIDGSVGKGGLGGIGEAGDVGGKGGIGGGLEEEIDIEEIKPPFNLGVEMVLIKAGTFIMGSPENEFAREYRWKEDGKPDPEKQHSVTLTRDFYMGKYEVTQAQWFAITGETKKEHWKIATTSVDGSPDGDSYPINFINWYDAVVFCNKLSIMEGLEPVYRFDFLEGIEGSTEPDEWLPIPRIVNDINADLWATKLVMDIDKNGYRLPTEAEWEYACRAGTTTAYHTGNEMTKETNTGWYAGNTFVNGKGSQMKEVGLLPPNPWGLHDMHGNVVEWCWDRTGYTSSGISEVDPTGPAVPSLPTNKKNGRLVRGGSYADQSYNGIQFNSNPVVVLRSASRGNGSNGDSSYLAQATQGFRLVRTATVQAQ